MSANIPKTTEDIILNSIQEAFETREKYLDFEVQTKPIRIKTELQKEYHNLFMEFVH